MFPIQSTTGMMTHAAVCHWQKKAKVTVPR